MKKVLAFVLCLVLALSCTAMAEEKPLKVALILTGVANDMGWNQAAYEGLELLEKEYGCEVAYTENCTTDDMAAALTDYAAAGYDIVFGRRSSIPAPMSIPPWARNAAWPSSKTARISSITARTIPAWAR